MAPFYGAGVNKVVSPLGNKHSVNVVHDPEVAAEEARDWHQCAADGALALTPVARLPYMARMPYVAKSQISLMPRW